MQTPERTYRILVLGINFSPELTGIGKYTGEMVEWLASKGYECTVITGYPYYPQWSVQPPYDPRFYKTEVSTNGKTKVYRCPLYVPRSPSSLKRILHDASFFASSLLMMLSLLFRPAFDFVFCVAPPFHLGLLGLIYKLFKGTKVVYHIQDLQIDAAQDLKMIRSKWLLRLMFKLEKYILKRSDQVSSISEGMIARIRSKTPREILLFPNSVDIKRFRPLDMKADVRKKWNLSASDKIILYSGSLGEKQGLDSIITIADELKSDESLRFVICGSGPYRDQLEKLARSLGVSNVLFLSLQPAAKLNEFLNLADVHLVVQKAGASDLVMPSKLSTILAVGGLAIVTADAGTGLFTQVNEHEIGIISEAENRNSLRRCIESAVNGNHSQIRINARRYAECFLSRDKVISNYLRDLGVDNV